MPIVKVWIHFVYEEGRVSEVFRLKPNRRGDCSPLAKARGNMENRGNTASIGFDPCFIRVYPRLISLFVPFFL